MLSIYAEYTKTILNDETYGAVVEDYVDLVCHKLEEMKEISYSNVLSYLSVWRFGARVDCSVSF